MSKRFALHLLDVGQGEAVIMDFPDGSFGLIDGGPLAEAPGIIPHLEERLRRNGLFRFVGISQWDADHIRGIPAVLRYRQPTQFWYPGVDLQLLEQVARRVQGEDWETLSSKVRDAIDRLPAESLRKLTAPLAITDIDGIEIHVLSPMPKVDAEIRAAMGRSANVPSLLKGYRNRASMALWIRVWGRVLFLSGELEKGQYRDMEKYFLTPHCAKLFAHRGDHGADWLKLSHHGADENNPSELFKLFARKTFVASASAGGGYDHPHPNVLKRAHFDSRGQGRVLCTNLGKGCSRLLRDKRLDPRAPERWSDGLMRLASPGRPCYQTISVTITEDGSCFTSTQGVQPRCPYGGPPDGKHAW